MYSKIFSASLYGLDAFIIEIEVQFERALPFFGIVGLPDATVKESRERVKAALCNSGCTFPVKKITVNLAPADLRKEGAFFDLPIAIGILAASGIINDNELNKTLFVGELSFEGNLRPVKGILSIILAAKQSGFKRVIIPSSNAEEATILNGIEIYSFNNLENVISFILNKTIANPLRKEIPDFATAVSELDYSEVRGQSYVKRGIMVSAAGNHNILMVGPPGSGKTMIARRIPTVLPPLTLEEAIELTRIYSVSGILKRNTLIKERPFRNPHHTASDAAIIGGGVVPKPGEVSLAHRGVLFLDEFPEFKKNVLNTLRQPLEDNMVTISRAERAVTYPANFMLVASMNPCPCGYSGHPEIICKCSEEKIRHYVSKISGPILDRIDIQLEVPKVTFNDMSEGSQTLSSSEIMQKVLAAREIQFKRFHGTSILSNSEMPRKMIEKYCKTGEGGKKLLKMAMDKLGLSARAYDKILRVSRTIADLNGSISIEEEHIMEAIQYRSVDRLLK